MGSIRYWIQPNSAYHSNTTADVFYFDVNGLNCFIQRGIPRERSYAESVRGMFFSKSPVEVICAVEWEGCEIGESVPVTVKVSTAGLIISLWCSGLTNNKVEITFTVEF